MSHQARPISRTRQKSLIAILLVMILSVSAHAEKWELNGTVRDSRGTTLVAASVVTNIAGVGAITDVNGSFHLQGESQRPTGVTVSYLGYKPLALTLKPDNFAGNLTVTLKDALITTEGITVSANRGRFGETPVAFSDITSDVIQRDYTTGDLPAQLSGTPNLYTYSDGGSMLGYSHIAIRGFDEKRISVYLNGIPLNDPEDHTTYFIDLPDFASDVRDIQVQRGVGESMYADGTFGGSVNVTTYALDQPRRFNFTTGIGEYQDGSNWIGQTTRQTLQFSSGLVEGRYNIKARYSRQSTGGYIENSWHNGSSYFISASRIAPKSTTTFNTYGGPMQTHAAWDGIDLDTYRKNRRANFLTYRNETDNFTQPHYELHNTYLLSDKATLNTTGYYIRGKGYFEQFKKNRSPQTFNIPDSLLFDPANDMVDVITQQWVKKNQLGINTRLKLSHKLGSHSFGVAGYYFDSNHWGQVNAAFNIKRNLTPGELYYQYFGKKLNFSAFADERYRPTENLNIQLSLQLRHVRYRFNQNLIGAFTAGPQNSFDLNWTFLAPRMGLNYTLTKHHSVFTSFSISSNTPRDQDIYDANDPNAITNFDVKSERVYDYEFGYRFQAKLFSAEMNLFYLNFDNEVIFWGVDDDGSRLTDNAKSSYHSGAELSASATPISGANSKLHLSANFSYNKNRYREYSPNIAVFDSTLKTTVDYTGKVIPGFPEVIGNFVADYSVKNIRLTYRFKGIGKQFVESQNIDSLSIKGFGVSTLSGSIKLSDKGPFGALKITATLDNMFDKEYIQSGYGGNYRNSATGPTVGWGSYFASAGRSYFLQLSVDIQ